MLEAELKVLRTNRHPGGAGAVLDVLIDRKLSAKNEAEEWVDIDTISALTGQRAVHSRISELRNEWKYVVEHNGRAGRRSAYRLVEL